MSKLVTWLKQLLTELSNIQTQRRLDKLWETYQEEEYFCTMLPVAKKAVQGKSAAELTAKLWVDILASGTVDRVIDNNVQPNATKVPIQVVVKRKNWSKFLAIVDKYPTVSKEL